MNQRALSVLEYDKITARLAEHASSAPGRAMCEKLLPCEYQSDAERALQETADAVKRMGQKGSVSFGSHFDSESLRSSLAIGATLEMRQLLRVASFLENVALVRNYGAGREQSDAADDTLSDYFRALEPLPHISGEIRRCVLSEEDMADEAEGWGVVSDVRDDRLILFFDRLTQERPYGFKVRAVTKGTFAVPPISAVGMYDPAVRFTGKTGPSLTID